ncbi:MAG: cation transporter [Bryobacterales bacterium]|jgi:copper chaperone CopZ|nr:cation transporter [Bryobacterales bacterium]
MTEKRTARRPPWLMLAAITAFGAAALVMFVTRKQQTDVVSAKISAAETKTVRIPIQGMVCTVCVSNVKKALRALDGVQQVEVSLEQREAQVQYVEGKISPQELVAAINQLGYKASAPVDEASQ